MLLLQKLDQITARYAELQAALSGGALDSQKFVAASKEYADLGPLVEAIDAWRKAERELGDAEAMTTLALRVVAEDLSVRQTEEVVRRFIEAPAPKAAASPATPPGPTRDVGVAEVEEILSEQLATRVSIQMGAKRGGRVVIEFGSPDDLERIVSEIVGSGPGLAPD